MSKRKPERSRRQVADVTIDECKAESEVSREAVNRAFDLMARWALRHGQKALADAGLGLGDLVTGINIKSYDAKNESN